MADYNYPPYDYDDPDPQSSQDHDDYDSDSQATQQTQSTQAASQNSDGTGDRNSHLWGYLTPVNSSLVRLDFWRAEPSYTIGRHTELNKIIFPGFKISNRHAIITWNGSDLDQSVTLQDLSSNGTFVNGVKIGKGCSRIIRDGCEIAFGTTTPAANPQEDYRFIYRHVASGPPTTGLYAYYDVCHELGKGSFATVMKAMNIKTGVWYAVKMIKDKRLGPTTVTGPSGTVRSTAIVREINIMEKLKHPNICELKEVFMEDDNSDINLVLELIEGGDLLEYILTREGLSEVESKNITFQLCDALSYIHAQGIAHRDLKPENVLLTKHNPPIVKVADFGLAKIVDSLTMLRTMCGTPSYLAPEVVKQIDHEGYDSLVDSWSVGVIVFSMLTNASPFLEDETQRDVRTRIAERTVDWKVLAGVDPSPDCEHFIRALLLEDPQSRMSLTEALNHTWLLNYTPVYGPSEHLLMTRRGNQPTTVTHTFLGMQLEPPRREGSRSVPLVRRSQVLSVAADEGRQLPEPSAEMVAVADANQARRTKRVRPNLTPLREGSGEGSSRSGASRNGSGSSVSGNGGKAPKRPRLRSDRDAPY